MIIIKLIINADDFGIDVDRDLGIAFGVLAGNITSVSVVVTNGVSWFRKKLVHLIYTKASVGIHVNLTDNPLSKYLMEDLCLEQFPYKKKTHLLAQCNKRIS